VRISHAHEKCELVTLGSRLLPVPAADRLAAGRPAEDFADDCGVRSVTKYPAIANLPPAQDALGSGFRAPEPRSSRHPELWVTIADFEVGDFSS